MPQSATAINSPVVGAESIVTLIEYDPTTDAALDGAVAVSINCTEKIRIKLPARTTKPVPCGLDSAAYMVPGMSEVGEFELDALDFANYDALRGFNGKRVIATINTSRNGVLLNTDKCFDWNCKVEVNHPKGDGDSNISCRGMFRHFQNIKAPSGPTVDDFGFGSSS
jgi:hypothetical protein